MSNKTEKVKTIRDTIADLKRWHDIRVIINKKPERKEKPLDNSSLEDAVRHLEDYLILLEKANGI